ncbi:MAG: PEP-utilizing enzyme, partial [Thiohalomonadales bacterium]
QPDIWSNSNFRDALPMVVPVAQRDANVYTVNQTILASFNEFGLTIKPGLSIAKLYNGRLYFNTGLYQRLIYDAVGMMPEDFNLFSGGHQPNIDVPSGSPFSGLQGLARIMRMIKYARAISREQKQQDKLYAKIETFVTAFKSTELANLPDQGLLDLLLSTEHQLLEFMDRYMLLSAGIGPFGMAIKSLKQAFGDTAAGIVSALATGQGDQPSANQVYGLLELAEIARDDPAAINFLGAGKFSNADWQQMPLDSDFRRAFADYLEKYGYRAVFEVDISQPRWHEDPSYLLGNIAKAMPTANLKRHKQRQQELYNNASLRLKKNVGFFKRQWVTKLVHDAVQGANTRETAKSYSVKLFGLMRFIYLEAGRRLHEKNIINEAEAIFDCSRADVLSILGQQWNGQGLKNLIAHRQNEIQALNRQDAPDVIIDNKNIFEKAKPVSGDNTYMGIGVSAGQIKGVARRVHDPAQGALLKPGEIMIAPSTDPSWTPLFLNAAGIVLETGGYTSHGSIVAREYGIPAVVNVPGALTLISDGQVVFVNGETGRVVLEL